MTLIDFPVFVGVWNRVQALPTPAVHHRIAHWLLDRTRASDRRLLLMAFRSCGKSTLVGLYAAWRLYANPNLRILVLAADTMLARRMVRNVKRIIEKHPLTTGLKPDRADQWGAGRFTVKRSMELRDPSMLARGVETNITGSRADLIIGDDVEVPKTADTAAKREKLRENLSESAFVLTEGGMQLYVGTPHSADTLYRTEDPADDHPDLSPAFLQGFTVLRIPILNERGESAWPERFTTADIDRLRAASGPFKFRSQMMLEAVSHQAGRLDVHKLTLYYDELTLVRELRHLSLGLVPIVAVNAYWDPAMGSPSGDRSVVAIVLTDDLGKHYIHDLNCLAPDTHGPDDIATQQCRAVADLCVRYHVPTLGIETNGIGRLLPGLLRRAVADARAPTSIIEIHHASRKESRILEAWDPPLAAGRLYLHRRLVRSPILHELQEWRPGLSHAQDDALDAVAGALSMAPVRFAGAVKRRPVRAWNSPTR